MKTDEAWEVFRAYEPGSIAQQLAMWDLFGALTEQANAILWKHYKVRRPDVVNDALLRAFSGWQRFREESKFSTWFHTIVVNAYLKACRREKRPREVPLERIPPASLTQFGQLTLASLALSEEDQLLVMRKIQGASDAWICKRLGISQEALRKRWSRLRKKISSQI